MFWHRLINARQAGLYNAQPDEHKQPARKRRLSCPDSKQQHFQIRQCTARPAPVHATANYTDSGLSVKPLRDPGVGAIPRQRLLRQPVGKGWPQSHPCPSTPDTARGEWCQLLWMLVLRPQVGRAQHGRCHGSPGEGDEQRHQISVADSGFLLTRHSNDEPHHTSSKGFRILHRVLDEAQRIRSPRTSVRIACKPTRIEFDEIPAHMVVD